MATSGMTYRIVAVRSCSRMRPTPHGSEPAYGLAFATHACVAQLAEHLPCKETVESSNLSTGF